MELQCNAFDLKLTDLPKILATLQIQPKGERLGVDCIALLVCRKTAMRECWPLFDSGCLHSAPLFMVPTPRPRLLYYMPSVTSPLIRARPSVILGMTFSLRTASPLLLQCELWCSGRGLLTTTTTGSHKFLYA